MIKNKDNDLLRVVQAKVMLHGEFLENERFLRFPTMH